MDSILPLEEIQSRFDKPVRLEQLGVDRLDEVAKRDPNGLLGAAFTVWQRYVRANPATDAGAVRDHIRRHGGDFLDAVQAVIGAPIIRDLLFSRCTIDDPALDDTVVAYLLLARVYPNDVHIADMSFANPYKPITPERRRYKFQKYKGLHLSGIVLSRIEKYASDHECNYLTLNAATEDLVPLFSKFGFTVEDGQATSLAMEKKIAR
jgi:hypothetical protein